MFGCYVVLFSNFKFQWIQLTSLKLKPCYIRAVLFFHAITIGYRDNKVVNNIIHMKLGTKMIDYLKIGDLKFVYFIHLRMYGEDHPKTDRNDHMSLMVH